MGIEIKGIEGMTVGDLGVEIQKGGKFVIYEYCISILIMTFKRSSSIYFIKANESATLNGLEYTFLSLLLGWWGFPWGPIYTIAALFTNLSGGKDVTNEILAAFNQD